MSEIVAFDLEGTLTAGVAWQGMRDYLIAHDRAAPFRRFFLRRLWSVGRYRLGLLRDNQPFKERWILDLLTLFTGFSAGQMNEVAAWVVEKTFWPQRRLPIIAELEAHQQAGRQIVLVSGMFTPFLDLFAVKIRAASIGTPLRFEDGRFTGAIAGPLNTRQMKVERLRAEIGDAPLFAAYGDTGSDIPLLRLAERPCAVHPDRQLRQMALAQQWPILPPV